ncbi:MAG: hypothetical protein J5889_09365 [Clostridia bacterium]|nr:hypothetical protein [Clostridia bacterium]
MIETLLTKPYWVIDVLPKQVPGDSAGQFFAVEKYWLEMPQYSDLRHRFAAILLKLNCYYNLQVCFAEEDELHTNPSPDQLVSWVTESGKDLCIVIPAQKTLITIAPDDLCMTVYNPRKRFLQLLEQLALSEGLFVWQPPQEGSEGK